MNKKGINKNISLKLGLFAICISMLIIFSGCDSNPVASLIIDNEQYTDKSSIDKAKQPKELAKTSDVYASVYFIESPKGIEYSVDWSINDKVVKSEDKPMVTDKSGVLVFQLENTKLEEGTLTLEVKYRDHILVQREIQVK